MKKSFQKYFSFCKIAFIQELHNPALMIMRTIFLIVILLVYHQIWTLIALDKIAKVNPVDFLWYLLITETLFFSGPNKLFDKIENDIKTGNFAYSLIRPVCYFKMRLAEGFGQVLIRLPIILSVCSLFTLLLTKNSPTTFYAICFIFPLCFLAEILALIFLIFLGLFVLVIYDAHPLYIIFSKFIFVFGGILFPITLYPLWFYKIATYTPFPSMGFDIARLIYEFKLSLFFQASLKLIGWIFLFSILLTITFNFLKKQVVIGGG